MLGNSPSIQDIIARLTSAGGVQSAPGYTPPSIPLGVQAGGGYTSQYDPSTPSTIPSHGAPSLLYNLNDSGESVPQGPQPGMSPATVTPGGLSIQQGDSLPNGGAFPNQAHTSFLQNLLAGLHGQGGGGVLGQILQGALGGMQMGNQSLQSGSQGPQSGAPQLQQLLQQLLQQHTGQSGAQTPPPSSQFPWWLFMNQQGLSPQGGGGQASYL